jgi:signal peptidase I
MTIQDVHSNGSHPAAADLKAAGADDLGIAEAAPTVAAPVAAPRRAATAPPGPRRKHDYRLRGLDLDALEQADPPVGEQLRGPSSGRLRLRRLLLQTVVVAAVLTLVAGVLRVAVVRPYSVQSTSMVPTIWPETDVLVATSSLLSGSVKRGDIVVLRQPDGAACAGAGSLDLVSRIIGLPGDTIWSESGRILINGEYLDRPTWHNPPYGEVGPRPIVRTTVPKSSYFVLGDNRTDTCDSRVFGPVAESDLVGEVIASTLRDGHPHLRGL